MSSNDLGILRFHGWYAVPPWDLLVKPASFTHLDSLEISHIAWYIYRAPVRISMYQNIQNSWQRKQFFSDYYTRSFLTSRTTPRILHMSHSMAWCLKFWISSTRSSHFGWQTLHFWAKICLSLWRQAMIDLWSCQVRSCTSNYLKMMCRYVQIPCAKNPLSSCVKKTNSGSKIQDPMNYFSQIPGVRTLTSFCFAVNGRVQEAKADGRNIC